MYEHMTFEKLLADMMRRAPDGIDTREGSIFYDAIAPAAAELANAYIELDYAMNEAFADTAEREFLIRRCSERNITPQQATRAVLKGIFLPAVPAGSRLRAGDRSYMVLEQIEGNAYRVECEQAGADGNAYLGTLVPVAYIDGLESATLTEVLVPGEDEEDTDALRARYFATFDSQAFGGNIADYREKVSALPGVGAVKVHPVWNGGGTVKVVLLSSEYKVPSAELISRVQQSVDPEESSGQGMGLAAIDHRVTVVGATPAEVSIVTHLTYQDGYDWTAVEEPVTAEIERYFDELRHSWQEQELTVVRISQIETRLLGVAGIVDINGTTLNGKENNLNVTADAVPVLGSVSDG